MTPETEHYQPPSDHIVLCGLEGLGFRTLEELRRLGEDVVVISHAENSPFSDRAARMGVTILNGNYSDESMLRAAGIEQARALVTTDQDDVANIHAALTAQELNPRLRIVLRIFNQDFGHSLESLFHDCEILSASAIAAPAFVAAALNLSWEQEVQLGGRTLRVHPADPAHASVLLSLGHLRSDGTTALFEPHPDPSGETLCLSLDDVEPAADTLSAPGRKRKPAHRRWSAARSYLATVLAAADRRLTYALLFLLSLGLASTVVLFIVTGFDLVDAFFNTTTIIISGGLGDLDPRTSPLPIKIFGTFLMIVGATTLTVFYALVTDAVVSVRIDRALGRTNVQMRNHIVVCGLGSIGYRVASQLHDKGVSVAAAEKNEGQRGIAELRGQGIPVVIADTRSPETLHALSAATARCVVIATDDDAANLETALNARSLNPGVRLVLRLFDSDFARRVEQTFDIQISRSVSALAAPRFAASAIAHGVVATFPINERVLILAQATVQARSLADGASLAALHADVEGKVIALRRKGEALATWKPPQGDILRPGDEVTMVATRRGLVSALQALSSIREDQPDRTG